MKWSKQQVPMDLEACLTLLNDMILLQRTLLCRFNSQEFCGWARLVYKDEMKVRRFEAIYGGILHVTEDVVDAFNDKVADYIGYILYRLARAVGQDNDTSESVKRIGRLWKVDK